MQTNRCGGDCGCEQKYKWHRLLAYDPGKKRIVTIKHDSDLI